MTAMTPSILQPYSAYKSSGVERLGDVPEHWDLVKLGRIGTFSKGTGGTKEDEVPEGIPCIRYGDLYTSHKYHIQATRSFVTETKAAEYTSIQYGDVLFAGSGETIEEIGKSAVNLINSSVRCGGDVILFRPEIEIDARFSGYAVDCPQSQYQKSCMGRGITIMHIYGDELKRLWLILPPLSEQAAIVLYLDYVDRRVRRYVSAKERLIGLLEEEKQAVINRAVTCGLDPNVPLKPSGVEWLGDMPAHWDLVPNRALLKLRKEVVGDHASEYTLHSLTKRGIVARDLENPQGKFPASFETYQVVEPGDLIFCLFDIDETPRTVGVSDIGGMITGAYTRFVCQSEQNSSFIYVLYLSLDNGKLLKPLYSGLRKVITKSAFLSAKLALPPPSEQAAIVDYLDKAAAGIDAAIDRARRQIGLLREYRTRLIADVVTGKLDVREAAVDLPEEADDDRAPIDESGRLAENIDGSVRDANEAVGELATAGEVTV